MPLTSLRALTKSRAPWMIVKFMLHKGTSTIVFFSQYFPYLNARVLEAGFDSPEYFSLQDTVMGNILSKFLWEKSSPFAEMTPTAWMCSSCFWDWCEMPQVKWFGDLLCKLEQWKHADNSDVEAAPFWSPGVGAEGVSVFRRGSLLCMPRSDKHWGAAALPLLIFGQFPL